MSISKAVLTLSACALMVSIAACSDSAGDGTRPPDNESLAPPTTTPVFRIPSENELQEWLDENAQAPWNGPVQEIGFVGDSKEEAYGTLGVQCDGPVFDPVEYDVASYALAGGAIVDYATYQYTDSAAAEAVFTAGAAAGSCGSDNDPPHFDRPQPMTVADGQAIAFPRYSGRDLTGSVRMCADAAWVLRDDMVLVVSVLTTCGSLDIEDYVPLAFP